LKTTTHIPFPLTKNNRGTSFRFSTDSGTEAKIKDK